MQKANSHYAWSSPPTVLDLQSHQVDIWRVHLDLPIGTLGQLEATLSEDESQRAAHFHFPVDRDRFIAAHGCLRDVLSRYLYCEPGQLGFSANHYGKPELNDHKLQFNLSHSGDFALVAVTQEHRVGIDIERIRQGISSQVIAQQYFSKSEVAELQALPLELREAAFFTCWTRKEAYIKAQGLGLSLPLESFDVSLVPNEPAILRATRPDPQEASRWMLHSLQIDSNHASAVAVESEGLEFRLWDWNINY
ncbi:MAG: 4'-phosphopantetheinyl transferase superfamily protein [Anaerolineae bacterium]|nr:4'-phosphopantetheinyl transferase superfamily protein [Anaerolineae bacterium]MCI0609728.1 4'-phosphopantetheinyl transferase superfamily protein [Anaerolineae bacterium]